MSARYDFNEIESRWQRCWDERRAFRAANPGEPGSERPKSYVLDFFPYPSGAGLHVGHPLGYIASDIVSRYQRMRGFNVLHPMGWDAFGLPAEQYAIETGVHPAITTRHNIDTYKRQLRMIGLSYDWEREVATCDADYYRWTQWIFLKIYDSWYDPEHAWMDRLGRKVCGGARPIDKLPIPPDVRSQGEAAVAAFQDEHRLAYLAEVPVNWCPALGTVLSNEEVTADGRSERGDHPVYRRPMKQWMLRITEYADRLLADLEALDWPEPIKLMQRAWIGRSEGAYVDFKLADGSENVIRVFTTRPDTLFGATYVVLAPEHRLVNLITVPERRAEVQEYVDQARQKSELARTAEAKVKTGVFTGSYAVNPVSDERAPIWVADYVLASYGTGSIMAVPGHDTRDYEFAKQFGLTIRDVIYPHSQCAMKYFAEHAREGETRGDRWVKVLADLLGVVTSRDFQPDQFADALQIVRSGRAEDRDPPGHAPPPDRPKRPGVTRGAIAGGWIEAITSLGFNDFEHFRNVFRHAEFYAHSGQAYVGDGFMVNCRGSHVSFDGVANQEGKRAVTKWLAERDLGEGTVQYKLRDWLFSRQRYWGEPFPILHRDDGRTFGVAESDLPVELPEMEDFRPHAGSDPNAEPQTPLSRAEQWLTLRREGRVFHRELNTMPQWAGSCWYYLRFLDPLNRSAFASTQVEQYWMNGRDAEGAPKFGGVDLYLGGAEHAVLHLLYARFWHKVLYDLGFVSTPEPFHKLFNQGYIQAYAYRDARGVYVEASEVVDADGTPAAEAQDRSGPFFHNGQPVKREYGKMGKSLRNVVNPDEIIRQFGADTLRLYEMYMGPLEASKPWNTRDILGVHRFLQRVWRLVISPLEPGNDDAGWALNPHIGEAGDAALERLLHKTIRKVGEDMGSFSFNTAIAQMIVWSNEAAKAEQLSRLQIERFLRILAPFAPHVCEELWRRLGHDDLVAHAQWPAYDEALTIDDEVEIAVQICGKVRARVRVPAAANDEQVAELARNEPTIAAHLAGKALRRTIVAKGRLVNFVL